LKPAPGGASHGGAACQPLADGPWPV